MMQFACPHCGPRAQAEFVYERTLDSVIPVDAAPGEAMERLFTRANPRGSDEELWRHTYGCRAWLIIRRHRVNHVIEEVRTAEPEALP